MWPACPLAIPLFTGARAGTLGGGEPARAQQGTGQWVGDVLRWTWGAWGGRPGTKGSTESAAWFPAVGCRLGSALVAPAEDSQRCPEVELTVGSPQQASR